MRYTSDQPEHPNWNTIQDWEGDHDLAAVRVTKWMRIVHEAHMVARGDSIWSLANEEKEFTVRHTKLDFDKVGDGLPQWIPVDDVTRFSALHPEPRHGYVLTNSTMTAAITLPTGILFVKMHRSRRCWIPRYGDWDDVYSMPKQFATAHSIVL